MTHDDLRTLERWASDLLVELSKANRDREYADRDDVSRHRVERLIALMDRMPEVKHTAPKLPYVGQALWQAATEGRVGVCYCLPGGPHAHAVKSGSCVWGPNDPTPRVQVVTEPDIPE